eukprot:6212228-Pleurochrysis_carterae.AAC.2
MHCQQKHGQQQAEYHTVLYVIHAFSVNEFAVHSSHIVCACLPAGGQQRRGRHIVLHPGFEQTRDQEVNPWPELHVIGQMYDMASSAYGCCACCYEMCLMRMHAL